MNLFSTHHADGTLHHVHHHHGHGSSSALAFLAFSGDKHPRE